jgi:glycosyltransferase involved in cell wall biosynthesis
VINATPETISEVLKTCLKMRSSQILEIGTAGRKYVEKWHDPDRIALRMKSLYEDVVRSG